MREKIYISVICFCVFRVCECTDVSVLVCVNEEMLYMIKDVNEEVFDVQFV